MLPFQRIHFSTAVGKKLLSQRKKEEVKTGKNSKKSKFRRDLFFNRECPRILSVTDIFGCMFREKKNVPTLVIMTE